MLLSDPVSVSMSAFQKQLEYAQKYGKFVQTCTAFIHQYRVRKFMDAVLHEEFFGRVKSIDAHLSLCAKDHHKVGVNPPPLRLGENQGCIRRLGRYCALFSIVLLMKLGCHPVSCQIHSATLQECECEDDEKEDDGDCQGVNNKFKKREPVKATGTVKYSNVRDVNHIMCIMLTPSFSFHLWTITSLCLSLSPSAHLPLLGP